MSAGLGWDVGLYDDLALVDVPEILLEEHPRRVQAVAHLFRVRRLVRATRIFGYNTYRDIKPPRERVRRHEARRGSENDTVLALTTLVLERAVHDEAHARDASSDWKGMFSVALNAYHAAL